MNKQLLFTILISLLLGLSACNQPAPPEPATATPVEPTPEEEATAQTNDSTTSSPLATPDSTTSSPLATPASATAGNEFGITPSGVADLPSVERADFYDEEPPQIIDPERESYQATIKTSKGDIVVSLNATAAPHHVNNFIYLSEEGFYEGLTFHRVEPNFVIQGGDPLGSGMGGPGYTIPGEFDLTHGAGALAMARLGDQVNPEKRSSGSQFYITFAPTPFLDGAYSVFGQVESGMDVVESITVGDTIEEVIIE